MSLLLGAGTSLGATAVNGAMTSAVMAVHRQNGWPEESGGIEWPVTLMVVATALAALGPGRWSVDHALGLDQKLDGGTGMTLAVLGVAAGLGQVAAMWKAPVVQTPASRSFAKRSTTDLGTTAAHGITGRCSTPGS